MMQVIDLQNHKHFFFDQFSAHTDADIYASSYNPKAKFRFKKFGYTFENISGLDLNYTLL